MTDQPGEEADTPAIARPAQTPEALRGAIARITPSRLTEFDRQLLAASAQAQELQQPGPLRTLCRRWGRHVEIQRRPATACRMADLEHIVDTGPPGH